MPRPKPTELLKLRGSWHANNRTDEPSVAPCIPTAPAWLSDAAREYWDEVTRTLLPLRLIGDPFAIAAAQLCDALELYVRTWKEAADAPITVETKSGPKINPKQKAKMEAWQMLNRALTNFGLSPSAIASVRPLTEQKQDELAQYKLHG